MDNIGNDITLIQRFDDLYLETSDRYRLTSRNTVHWRRPNALFIPILVETLVCACSLLPVFILDQNRFAKRARTRRTITFRFIRLFHAQVARYACVNFSRVLSNSVCLTRRWSRKRNTRSIS